MPFRLSPFVQVREQVLQSVISAVATSRGATVGQFAWGPADEITLVETENQLRDIFGEPNNDNFRDWFTCASFLAYARSLAIVRAVSADARNSTVEVSNGDVIVGGTGILVKNADDHELKTVPFQVDNILFVAKHPGVYGDNIGIAWANHVGFDESDSCCDFVWPFRDLFVDAPDENHYHVVVFDFTGKITGTPGTALEVFQNLSSDPAARTFEGTTNYLPEVLNRRSIYAWVGAFSLITALNSGVQFGSGSDGTNIGDAERQAAFSLYQNAEEVDVNLVMQAGGSALVGKYIIDNIANYRRDCVAFVSPRQEDVVGVASENTILNNILATRNIYGSTSYAVMDSQWKQINDRYNGVLRWVPVNGDIAGLCALTDFTNDPWWSPAGNTRGVLRNVVKLAWKQDKVFRDELYKRGINPIINKPEQGPTLFGDRTLLQLVGNAFRSINVRRLFITIEKAIATFADDRMFDFNDEFTRAQFVNAVEPYLRDVQGRRGIINFTVICNDDNNDDQVVQNQQFVADIFVQPNRSINFIQLNFVSVDGRVNFEEIGS